MGTCAGCRRRVVYVIGPISGGHVIRPCRWAHSWPSASEPGLLGETPAHRYARALILRPELIIADEPVSALDVSIQAQVLNMMRDLQRKMGLTYLFISHDLGVVRYLSTRIGVMYLGKLVEVGPADEVYLTPAHPYTQGLIDSAPVADPQAELAKARSGVRGELPSAINPPSGCRFRTRCPLAQEICAEAEPPLRPFSPGQHLAACHFPLQTPMSAGPGAAQLRHSS